MDQQALRALLHQVNNLLAVIQLQVEVARADDAPETARRALALIADAATRTATVVAEARAMREAP